MSSEYAGDISLPTRINLCCDNQHDLKYNEIDLRAFGDVLQRMGKFELAETIYHRLLDKVSSSDSSLARLYHSLGNTNKEKKNYDSRLKWYQNSLEVFLQTHTSAFINLENLYGSMGEGYSYKKNIHQSLDCYEKAIK
ncbi:unnamed protein product [Rotaria sordida]|uniref:Uncharacterized protein n=1 Tax=Rotaria sordida TaxID=392033 RepID=A0A819C164_9BILA|nr:unnamed protein product [Rotaria sordida]CAF1299857.1 unnamed protein product [Rotaria sordida]CAF3609758.1 unnamed protein product [Rotaria sordida]CAF3811120.1 unnamed protein product [Rotaria sordida]